MSKHKQAAESEVSFDELDGSNVRIGIIKTRWNAESFELPLAARFLALSGTVDAIVTAGVLIKGEVSLRTNFLRKTPLYIVCFRFVLQSWVDC